MARQTGDIVFTGTWGCVTFYEMNGQFYARMKSTLTGKRVKNDPAYALTRLHAGWLAIASPIASAVYRHLPKETRKRADYQSLTGMAIQLLKAGIDAAEVRILLEEVGVEMLNNRKAAEAAPVNSKPVVTIDTPAEEEMAAQEDMSFVFDEMDSLVKLPFVVPGTEQRDGYYENKRTKPFYRYGDYLCS